MPTAPLFIWLGWAVVVAGVALITFGWVGRRVPHPICRRCAHPVPPGGGHVGQVCTECGVSFQRPTDVQTHSTKPLIGWIGLILIASALPFGLGDGGRTRILKALLPRYRVADTQTLGQTTVRVFSPTWDDDFEGLVDVTLGGNLVFRSTMPHPSAGQARVHMLADQPGDLIWIRSDSGGSGGYSTTYLFLSASDDGRAAFLPFGVLENGIFQSLPGQPVGEKEGEQVWVQPDISYRYWLTSGAASPVPTLRAVPVQGGLRFLDPLPDDGPTDAELEQAKATIARMPSDQLERDTVLGPTLRGFFDLVYAGKAKRGWKFFRECYDLRIAALVSGANVADLPRSREAFESVLQQAILKSPFSAEVLRRNHGSIAPTSAASTKR
jgi:hypothetical protein